MTAPDSPALLLSLIFGAAVLAALLLKSWLAWRQMCAVARGRAAVPAQFAHAVTLHAHQRAADYTAAKLRLGLLEQAFAAAVLLGWTLLGGLDALNGLLLAAIGTGHPMVQPLALLTAFTLIGALLDLPFSLYHVFVLEQRFGFNKMSLRLWLSDLLMSALLGASIGLPLAALVLWLMDAAGPHWWLWVWCAWMAFSLLTMLIYPTLIAPLFNKFQPLADPALEQRIAALLARCGFAAKGVFVMDGSRRSAHANAYFTGLGAARRVVLFDTLLTQLEPAEIEAVLAHELGHFKRRHIAKRIVLIFALSLALLALLGWLAGQDWFYLGLGVTPNLPASLGGGTPNHALTLLLFMLAAPVFGFFLSPLMAYLSRRDEFEADAYAASHASAQDMAHALLKVHKDNANTLTPDSVYVRFYYSHPTVAERIARLSDAGHSASSV